jgi:four helix bundle protein
MKDNVLLEKSFAFAVRVVGAHKHLQEASVDFALARMFLTSGTGIAAHCEDAVGANSRADFSGSLALAYKDARRTKFWIRLLHATGCFKPIQAESLLHDVEELLKIIGSIQRTIKRTD